MKALVKMIIRYTVMQTLFFIICLPFFFLPRFFHFKFLYPIFEKLYLFAPKIRVVNLSTIKKIKTDSPVIVASNHKSFADFCCIAKYLRNKFVILSKEEAFHRNIISKIIAWKMHLIPVDRKNAVSQLNAMLKAKKLISKYNYSAIIFPEGWYHYDVPVGKLKSGVSILAKETGAKVIPAAIYGINHKFLEERSLRWKTVYIKFGKTLDYKDYNDVDKFLDAIKTNIEKLYGEIEEHLKESDSQS